MSVIHASNHHLKRDQQYLYLQAFPLLVSLWSITSSAIKKRAWIIFMYHPTKQPIMNAFFAKNLPLRLLQTIRNSHSFCATFGHESALLIDAKVQQHWNFLFHEKNADYILLFNDLRFTFPISDVEYSTDWLLSSIFCIINLNLN